MIRFHALGGLTITEHGQELGIGGPRQRRLVAVLLVHRNEVVSVDRLADAVFAGDPTPAAGTTLRSYVARLRKVLGHADGIALVTQAPGYVLRVPDDAFDVARFEALAADARGAVVRGDAWTAAVVLRDALGLWRGEPYAEFSDEEWVLPEAQRLVELRLSAQEALFEAELACGRAADLVPELEAMARAHPLREGLRAQLVVALYRAGRHAEALRALRDHRSAMVEELGLDPSPALQRLEERILAHDPELLLERPADPRLRGYRLGERLGSGADGTVHVARLAGVDRALVIRTFRPEIADDPAFVRAFDRDVRRVAGLHHPAVVPIHDHWREPGAAHLVMRRMAGGSLADRLERGPLAAPEVESLVRRVGGALVAAAEAGFGHGRVNARNVLHDASGEPHLTDFSIPLAEADAVPDLRDVAALVAACLADPHAADAVRRAGASAPTMADFVRAALAALAPQPPSTGTPLINPYKGLRAFDEADADDYFGRTALIDELLGRLAGGDLRSRLVLVVGGSGSGKSSAVRAGLLPRLRRGDVPGSDGWYITTMLPGSRPFEELAEALRRVAVSDDADLVRSLEDEGGIDRAVRCMLPEGGELLVVVDQLEELFTSATEVAQRSFLRRLLGAVTAPGSRLRVVATLRADFYDRPLAVPGFGGAVHDATVTIPAMSPAEVEAAIVEPAERVGRRVERPLVAELVRAVGDEPGALPALQFTLWELAARDRETLSMATYRELGGLTGSIAARAEHLYRAVDPDERDAVRALFEQLVVVTPEGEPACHVATRAELAAIGVEAGDRVIDRWAEARLLTLDRHPRSRAPTVGVAHEALLREWPRLRRWVEDDRGALIVRTHLREAAASWEQLERDPGALYRGARLQVALDTIGGTPLGTLERSFLDASRGVRDAEAAAAAELVERQARANRRLRAQLAVIGVALVVALAGGLVAIDQRAEAQQERRIAAVRELATAAEASATDDPERAMLLALSAIDATGGPGSARPEAIDALHRALTASRLVRSVPGLGGALDWSSDGRLFVTEGPEEQGLVDLRDAATGASVRSWRGHDIDINDVVFSPDSSLLATTGDDGYVRVWDVESGEERMRVRGEGEASVWGPSFSPDGSLVAASWLGEEVVRVVDVATGEAVRVIEPGASWFTEFSPDGDRLLLAPFTQQPPRLVDIGTGDVVMVLDGDHGVVREARFSPDGRWIAVASAEGVAAIWDVAAREQRFTVDGHTSFVNAVDWSADGRRLATGADDGTARVHEVATTGVRQMHVVSARDMRNGVQSVAFSPDGDRVMTGDWGIAAVKVWDVSERGGAELTNARSVPGARGSGTFLPDGRHLVAANPDTGFDVWDVETGELVRHVEAPEAGPGPIHRMAVDPDGEVVAGTTDLLPVHLWDLRTGEHLGTVGDPSPECRPPEEGAACVFVADLAWSPDGELLAIADGVDGGSGGGVTVVERDGSDLVRIEEEDDAYVVDVAFSPEGDRVVTTRTSPRDDPALMGYRVWDATTGRLVRRVRTQAVTVAWDPAGDRIASTRQTEGGADVWHARSGERIAELRAATPFFTVAFDGAGRVITGGGDGTVRIWDPRTGVQQHTLRGHTTSVESLALSPDGSRLSSLDDEGLLRVWALDAHELVDLARRRLTRVLDDAECRQYLHVQRCAEA